MKKQIPYKIYLSEKELPKKWLNLRAFMDKKPAPLLNPETLKPITEEELGVLDSSLTLVDFLFIYCPE